METLKTITYAQVGSKKTSQVPVLMIHGHGGDHRGLMELAGLLDCEVYVPDLPGFGESKELTEHTMANYTLALKQFVTDLGLKEYYLVGHSLGSAIALTLAANDKRVKKLVLLNAIPEFSKIIRSIMLLLQSAAAKIPEQYSERLIHAHLYNLSTFLINARKRTSLQYTKDYLKHQSEAQYSLKAWRETGEAIYSLDQMTLAEHTACPTLLVHGDKDTLASVKSLEKFEAQFPHASLVRLAKSGHFMHLEHPQRVADEINKFLTK